MPACTVIHSKTSAEKFDFSCNQGNDLYYKKRDDGILLKHNLKNTQSKETHQVHVLEYNFPNASMLLGVVALCFPYNKHYSKNFLLLFPRSLWKFAIFLRCL